MIQKYIPNQENVMIIPPPLPTNQVLHLEVCYFTGYGVLVYLESQAYPEDFHEILEQDEQIQ